MLQINDACRNFVPHPPWVGCLGMHTQAEHTDYQYKQGRQGDATVRRRHLPSCIGVGQGVLQRLHLPQVGVRLRTRRLLVLGPRALQEVLPVNACSQRRTVSRRAPVSVRSLHARATGWNNGFSTGSAYLSSRM